MKKILIIEDNIDIRENLIEFLEISSYATIATEKEKKGIELVKECDSDLIICDHANNEWVRGIVLIDGHTQNI